MPLWAFWEQPLRGPAPHLTCATNNPDYIFLWHSKPAPDDRWASSKALQLARVPCNCLPQQHDVLFFRFPNENYGDIYVLIVSSMKLMYHKGWRTYVLSQILSVTHPPAVGLRSRCRPLTSVSFNYAPSLPPSMLPFSIIVDIYIIKLRMWRDGSRRFVWVGGSVWVLADPRFIQFALGSC